MIRRIVLTAAAVFVFVVVAGCGSDRDALAQTDDNLAKLDAADMDLQLAATSGAGDSETAPVGFRLQGPYALNPAHKLAVFDLTYTRLLGGDEEVTKVRSTGSAAFVTLDSKTYRLAAKDTASLRVSEDAAGGITDFGIADWVRNTKIREGGKTDVITGDVNAGEMLSDLARVAGSVGSDTQLSALDAKASARLQKLVRGSSIRVVTTHDTHELRSLRAVLNFGTKAPEELRRTLGRYAEAKIEVNLTLAKSPRSLQVAAPKTYTTL